MDGLVDIFVSASEDHSRVRCLLERRLHHAAARRGVVLVVRELYQHTLATSSIALSKRVYAVVDGMASAAIAGPVGID